MIIVQLPDRCMFFQQVPANGTRLVANAYGSKDDGGANAFLVSDDGLA